MADPKEQQDKDGAVPASRDDISPPRGQPFGVVGIGASAGGLEAISTLLRELPKDTGMAYVIVQHLDPNHESRLPDLLAPNTGMPVATVTDGLPVAPNHVYVIPPKADLTLEQGHLRLLPRRPGLHLPIDIFFESLAQAQGGRAIGIVLSGNASDGSQGLRAIKGECGLTFAQDEGTARHGGMPRSAAATGAVDFILPPVEIARELVRISKHPYVVPPVPDQADLEVLPEGDGELKQIFALLQSNTKVDFSHYKLNTVRRRIGRRMIVQRTPTLTEYARHLDKHPLEVRELYRDLLISVTNFFRDPPAFAALSKRLSDMLLDRRREDPIRIWVPGCATGEEVYSLAITVCELVDERSLNTPIQVFGTDISEVALERARAGIFPESVSENVSSERLRRFFSRVDSGYLVNRSLRELCVFARQDITKDPPFAHTDLITCRNVLIYMNTSLQRRILPIFHYSLNPSGLLMLGSAETVGAAPDLFEAVDKQYRIYARKAVPVRLTLDLALGRDRSDMTESQQGRTALGASELIKKVDRVIQSKYSPAAVVIDSDLRILHFRGRTNFYLDPAPGDASLGLLRMVRETLVIALRRSIETAAAQGISIRENGVGVDYHGQRREINIEVTPIMGVTPGEQYFLVVFEEAAGSNTTTHTPPDPQTSDHRALLQQLAETREYLRNLNEDHETSTEELRAANEEVRSSNEELQSTNEELSTTKEELQSANEELTTVNEELQNRNHELDTANNDLSNLLSAVSIPIVMVDSSLRVRRFNTAAERLLDLTAVDIGRPAAHLKGNIEMPQLEQVVRSVLDTLETQQQEVRDKAGHWYMLVVRPYRTADNRIDGAVIVFIDIDPLKRSLTVAEESRDYAEGMIETVREPLLVLDADLRVQRATVSFYDTFRVTREETLGRFIYDLGNGQWNRSRLRELLGDALFRNQPFQDYEIEHEFPHVGRRTMRLNARRIPRQDKDHHRTVLLSIEDVTERRGEAEIRYQHLFESAKDGILVLDAETELLTDVNPYFLELTGYSREELVGRKLRETPPFSSAGFNTELLTQTMKAGSFRYITASVLPRKGVEIDLELIGNRYTIGNQEVVQINVRDLTGRQQTERARLKAEEALRQANQKLQRANLDLETFAYAASEDIQEPLRSISLYTELFQNRHKDAEGEEEQEAEQFLQNVNQAVDRLQALVGDLLSYTHATAAFAIPATTIDPAQVLDAVIAKLQPLLDEQQVVIVKETLPHLRMHAGHLLQLFRTILSNALKYRGDEPLRITVAASREGMEHIVSISDNGIGMDPEYAKRIFGMYKHLNRRERPGLGIALAVCEKIVEHYDGRIWVESAVGQGSTVFFSIPV
jgi:two-component system CheB/CheR fusion protein